MPSAKLVFGQRGETFALNYLKKLGYIILGQNWRCQQGEIDIIAQQGSTIVFVEVRTRHTEAPDAAFASITPRKRAKLGALAALYLAANDQESADWRVDVIAIALPRSGAPVLEHAEDALDW